jgi:hypothetical protein
VLPPDRCLAVIGGHPRKHELELRGCGMVKKPPWRCETATMSKAPQRNIFVSVEHLRPGWVVKCSTTGMFTKSLNMTWTVALLAVIPAFSPSIASGTVTGTVLDPDKMVRAAWGRTTCSMRSALR